LKRKGEEQERKGGREEWGREEVRGKEGRSSSFALGTR